MVLIAAVEKHEKTCLNNRRNRGRTGLSPVKKKRKIVSDGSDKKGAIKENRRLNLIANHRIVHRVARQRRSSLLLTPSNTQDSVLPSVDLDDSEVNEEEYGSEEVQSTSPNSTMSLVTLKTIAGTKRPIDY